DDGGGRGPAPPLYARAARFPAVAGPAGRRACADSRRSSLAHRSPGGMCLRAALLVGRRRLHGNARPVGGPARRALPSSAARAADGGRVVSDIVSAQGISKDFAAKLPLSARIMARLSGRSGPRAVRALDGVDLTIRRGEALGLVGESGSGKSTLGRIIAGLIAPSEGCAMLDGAPVRSESGRGHKLTTRIQVVFQDPFASLDPRMCIGDTIAEGPLVHGLVSGAEIEDYVARWLATVGLDASAAGRFPHQFSGGQRQRV